VSLARWAFVLLVPVVPFVQRHIDARLGVYRAQEEALYLTGKQLRRLSPGFEDLMADLFWLRAVQYYGGQRIWGGGHYELLAPLIDVVTDLDPRLEIAYRYGAIFLSEKPPVGAGDPQGGVSILEKGVRNNPLNWRLRQDLGFLIFTFMGDAQRGAAVLLEAARLPGAPFWLDSLAAQVLYRGGDRETSRQIWRGMYEQAEEGPMKYNALAHLRYLDALDEAEALTRLVRAYEERTGRKPDSLDQLRAAGLVRGPLADPSGTPFVYDRETGTASIDRKSELWRPLEPGGKQ
jgi:hypothetical protein